MGSETAGCALSAGMLLTSRCSGYTQVLSFLFLRKPLEALWFFSPLLSILRAWSVSTALWHCLRLSLRNGTRGEENKQSAFRSRAEPPTAESGLWLRDSLFQH